MNTIQLNDHFDRFNMGLFTDNSQPQLVYSFSDSLAAKVCSQSLFETAGDKIGGIISTGNHLIVSVSDQNLEEIALSIKTINAWARFHSLITTNSGFSSLQSLACSAVQKVNDDLYIAKRPQDKDLSFGLVRLTDRNLAFWWELHTTTRYDLYRRRRGLIEEFQDKWTVPQKRFMRDFLDDGPLAFRNTLKMYETYRKRSIRPEIWIAYALSGVDLDPSRPLQEELFPRVEMAVTVLTYSGVPVVVHMGISRTVWNLTAIYNEVLPKHEAISIPLHAFAAKAILSMPEGHDKRWLRTRPTSSMADIFCKSLPENLLVKDTQNMPVIFNEDGSLTVKDARGGIISHFNKEDLLMGKLAFYDHPDMHQSMCDDYAIPYDSLADYFL